MAVLICIVLTLLGSSVLAQDKGLYKMWLEGLSPCQPDQDLLVNMSGIKVSHYNRTTLTVRGDLKLLKTIDEETTMRLVGFKKGSHSSWSKTLLDTNIVKACEQVRTDKYFWPSLVDISNLPATCPITQGEYNFKEAALTFKQLPPMVPLGCYKLVLSMWTGGLKSCNNIFVKVGGPEDSPNPRCNH